MAGFLRTGLCFFPARRVLAAADFFLAAADFFPDDFFFLAGLVGRFFETFFSATFRFEAFFPVTFRAFFGAAFFLMAFFFDAFFFNTFFFKTFFLVVLLLAEAFLGAFFAAFFLAFFTTGWRRAELGRLALALVFLVAAFLAGIALPPGPNFRNGRLYRDHSLAEASRHQNW